MDADVIVAYKLTRHDGTDFRTGTVDYAAALASGNPIVHPNPDPPNAAVCGAGLHVSDTPRKTIWFRSREHRPYRWFEVGVRREHVICADERKMRVSQLTVVREIGLADIFGPGFAARIDAAKEEAVTWKKIPWFTPPKGGVTEDGLVALFRQWHAAITPWLQDASKPLPDAVKVVRKRKAAAAAADTAADAADADAAADTDADAAADAAAAAADADADAAAADADAAAADADAVDAAADADAAAVDADADADDAIKLPWWMRWYVRPRYVLWRYARWAIAGMTEPSPWAPLVEIYRLGCLPIGYAGWGEFVIYWPDD